MTVSVQIKYTFLFLVILPNLPTNKTTPGSIEHASPDTSIRSGLVEFGDQVCAVQAI